MKPTLNLIAAAILGIATLQSCTKKSSTPSYTMTATINGASFSKSCIAQKSGNSLSIDGGTFSGTTATYPYIILTITNYAGVGTYTLGATAGATGGAAVDSSSTVAAVAMSGSVSITSVSPQLTGTFNFKAQDNTTVTNGAFTAVAP